MGESQWPGREGTITGEGCWDSRTMVSIQRNSTCQSLDRGSPVSTRALSLGPFHQHSWQWAEAFDGSLDICGWEAHRGGLDGEAATLGRSCCP